MTEELVIFLNERFAEDAAVLESLWTPPGSVASYQLVSMQGTTVMARPSRVQAELDAKRQIAKLHGPVILRGGSGAKYFDTTTVCGSCEPPQFAEHAFPCKTLRLLALPYADHPDYRQEWKP